MTLRRVTFDNSVKNIAQSQNTKEPDIKPNTIKKFEQEKKISQKSKNIS